MKPWNLIPLATLLTGLFVAGCSKSSQPAPAAVNPAWADLFARLDLNQLPPPASRQGLTYAADVRPIMEGSCFRCHGPERQRGGLRLDSLEALRQGGEHGEIIAPGDSQHSLLVVAVAQLDDETAMPPKPRPGGPGGPGAPAPGLPGASPNGGRGAGRPGGPGGPGGGFPMRGPDGPGGFGPPPTPITPEQVGLLRAWIDQGAK